MNAILVPTGEGNATIPDVLGDASVEELVEVVASSIAHHRIEKRYAVADDLRKRLERWGYIVKIGKDGSVTTQARLA